MIGPEATARFRVAASDAHAGRDVFITAVANAQPSSHTFVKAHMPNDGKASKL